MEGAEDNTESSTNTAKMKLRRCMDWLQKQNSLEPKKQSLQNKNDIQFIIQTNADRKNFLLAAAEDDTTLPPGIGEPALEPKAVPLHRLRVQSLYLECEWKSCRTVSDDYEKFQKHVKTHISDLEVTVKDNKNEYACLWDVCHHKTFEFSEMVRHINYHAYHSKLLAIGFNGRATLKLARCKKDSTKRHQLPVFSSDHCCMWTGCNEKFNSIQTFFDHVKQHIIYSTKFLCSWAGCGASFHRRVLLTMHMRSHTGERLIACYHCGQHFANNRKLCDHLRRQNVYESSPYACSLCGVRCATEYLLNEHSRQHVSAYACALCDMSAQSPAALAQHVRYRHLAQRLHACPHCDYRAVTKWDLRKHIPTHTKKKKKRKTKNDDTQSDTDEENSEDEMPAKKKTKKKYACHMCPDKEPKIFSRGTRLTTHLVEKHGAQWPFGHSRFRYQISEDGMYRLTTTRYEVLEVSKKIVDGNRGLKELLSNTYEYNISQVAEATENTPTRFEITLKNDPEEIKAKKKEQKDNDIEILMCDVDEEGNIISTELVNESSVQLLTQVDNTNAQKPQKKEEEKGKKESSTRGKKRKRDRR